jgi:DNA repair protein RadC
MVPTKSVLDVSIDLCGHPKKTLTKLLEETMTDMVMIKRKDDLCILVKEGRVSSKGFMADNPYRIARVISPLLSDLVQEEILVLCLDSMLKLRHVHRAARGSLGGASVTPADVFRAAVISGSRAIVLAHNHPSGDSTPSHSDVEMTKSVISAGKILGIHVLDHLVFASEENYTSLREYCSTLMFD